MKTEQLNEELEARGDLLAATGLETLRESEESNEFERRVMGTPGKECPCCGAEIGRRDLRCGTCETLL